MKKKKDLTLNPTSAAAVTSVTGEAATDKALDSKATVDTTPKGDTVSNSSIKEEVTPKNVINTAKAAELVGNGAVSPAGMGASLRSASRVINYSGAADIGNDQSANIKGDAVVKSGNRPGRQIDTPLMKIDDATAESYVVPIKTIPQLKSGESSVGYNGNYENEHAISQKGSGGSPADNKFFRTLDQSEHDIIYYGVGQLNALQGDTTLNINIDTYDTANDQYSPNRVTTRLGNYLPSVLKVTFNANGSVADMEYVDNEDIAPACTEDELRVAGDAAIRLLNVSEADRLAMIDEASDETKSNWSYLGKAIRSSSDVNLYLSEYDKTVGDIATLSYGKLSHALAFQINKAGKDGLRRVAPMYEMVDGDIDMGNVRVQSSTATDSYNLWHNHNAENAAGSAALYVIINDSVNKYNTKGKLLSLPLSFKTALATAAKNMGVLRAHQSFIDEFNRQEVFGKVDEDGTGMTPFFMSDGAKVTFSVDFNHAMAKEYDNNNRMDIGNLFVMHYEDLRNRYNVPFYDYFNKGLLDYFNRYGSRIAEAIHVGNNRILTIPITSTTTAISLWDVIVCAAMKDIAIHRKYAMDAVLRYESLNGHYPYSGSIQIDSDMAVTRPNIQFTDIQTQLGTKNIPLNVATRLLLPEVFTPISYVADDFGGLLSNKHGYVTKVLPPFYFNQNAFDVLQDNNNGYKWVNRGGEMSNATYFDFRQGLTLANADRIFSMDPEQLRLSFDRMVTLPGMNTGKQVTRSNKFKLEVFKYSYHEDGIPIFNVYAKTTDADDEDRKFRIIDILKTPRELGLSFIAPAGVVTPTEKSDGTQGYRKYNSSYFLVSGPSFRIKYWHVQAPNGVQEYPANTLFTEYLNNNLAVNFSAVYETIFANPYSAGTDIGIKMTSIDYPGSGTTTSVGEYISPFVTADSNEGTYDPNYGVYTSTETQIATTGEYANYKLFSNLKYLYTRLQLLPYILSPFEVNTFDFDNADDTNKWTAINNADPYEFLHLFNMCGFRAGEYSGTQFDRNRDRIQLGLAYVQDPYIERRL